MTDPIAVLEASARAIVAGRRTLELAGMLELASKLQDADRFELARRVLAACLPHVVANAGQRLKVAQRLALCTYKSTELPDVAKYDDAMAILARADDLALTGDQETLGLAGAIRKRQWEREARRSHLVDAFGYYHRGYLQGVGGDDGYTAVNAAYVLDCLAAQDAEAAGDDAASTRRQLAASIRQEVVDILGAKVRKASPEAVENWVLVTLSEAAFALQQFDEARHWLMASARRERPEWARRTTATQLTALLRLMAKDPQRAVPDRLAAGRALLAEYLGHEQAALDSVLRGKIGLALSGGGFRASFFHLGVMARLAELDLLRHVECLSCVSGGSIVGAHFYLELKKLLEDRHDVATPTEPGIAKQDYIDIVRRVQRDFLAGVQTNVRTRVAADLFANLRMIFRSTGSRTLRVGELYEEQIFARVDDEYGGQPRWLDELLVQPKGTPCHFRPEVSNWRRFAKVPTLVLNATTLNTGHCWQFTANWMGEAPSGVSGIDANARLRRVYHHDLPAAFDRVRLGHAVAASACVPGLFEPLTLRRLYRGADGEDMLVRLVDGGVHDNQGVATLVDEDCAVMIVSDGSQQMGVDDRPGSSVVSAPLRSNDILQERVRTAQHAHLDSRRRGGLLRGLAFLHLKQGLDSRTVDWIDCQDPAPAASADPMLAHGVQRHLQRAMAGMRTDLDSFTDAEAFALMADGYLLATQTITSASLGFEVLGGDLRVDWPFDEVIGLLACPTLGSPFSCHLQAGSRRFLKAWQQVWWLRLTGIVLLAVLAVAGLCAVVCLWNTVLMTLSLGRLVSVVLAIALSVSGLGWLARWIWPADTLRQLLLACAMAFGGWVLANLHLRFVDPVFLAHGRIGRLKAEAARQETRKRP